MVLGCRVQVGDAMTCLRLKSNKPGVPDGFVCVHPVYKYDGYLFEVHSYCGPMPLRKDLEPRMNVPAGFWDMWERFKVLSDEEKAKYLYKEA